MVLGPDFAIVFVKDMPSTQLLSLTVRGLGVISDVTLDFQDGFTVITGETGAGKTLLVDALSLCLGGEARSPRRGDELDVSAVFLDATGKECSLQRTVSSAQRLRAVIDGVATSSDALRSVGDAMLVIHGQHDSLRLKSKIEILKMVDDFGAIDTSNLLSLRQERSELLRLQSSLGGDARERERQLDFARFEANEIESIKIVSPRELDDTLDELVALTELRDQVANVQRLTAEADGDGSLEAFVEVVSGLPQGGELGESRRRILDLVAAVRDELSEVGTLIDSDRLDESHFHQLESRVEVLRNLARKHGGTLEGVLAAYEQALMTISTLEDADGTAREIEGRIESLQAELKRESARVLTLRTASTQRLEAAVSVQLPRVALPNAKVTFAVGADDGSDVELVFAPNPGSPGGPIQTIASGGELSRVLLALSLVTSSDGLVTVFDEIDSGIGGNVAESIGECLADLARSRQVISVTHLASVAARADHHFVVEKHVVNGETRTSIRSVSGSERVSEIARMLAGESASTESRALAERLLGR